VKTTPETLNDNIRTPLEMPDGHQCFGINELMVSAISALRAGSGFGDGMGSVRGNVLQQLLDDGFHGDGFSLGSVVGQDTVPKGGNGHCFDVFDQNM